MFRARSVATLSVNHVRDRATSGTTAFAIAGSQLRPARSGTIPLLYIASSTRASGRATIDRSDGAGASSRFAHSVAIAAWTKWSSLSATAELCVPHNRLLLRYDRRLAAPRSPRTRFSRAGRVANIGPLPTHERASSSAIVASRRLPDPRTSSRCRGRPTELATLPLAARSGRLHQH
jgi:hypothetical protein